MNYLQNTLKTSIALFILTTMLTSCSSKDIEMKKACIDIDVVRNHKFVTVDSCFTAPTSDSLEKIIADVRAKLADPHLDYNAKLLFIIVDTLNKKPDEYEYAMVVSDAGIINPDVVLTSDQSIVKERSAPFSKANIILKKLIVGEKLTGCVETIFKTNVRINYRRESNVKVKN